MLQCEDKWPTIKANRLIGFYSNSHGIFQVPWKYIEQEQISGVALDQNTLLESEDCSTFIFTNYKI